MLARFTKPAGRPFEGDVTYIPGVLSRYSRHDGAAGHVRIFGRKVLVHWWSRTAPSWALTRAWYVFGLVTIIHIEGGDLKRCNPAGWHFRFASIGVERCYGGFSITARKADRGYTA